MTKNLTIKELAEIIGQDYLVTSSLVKVMIAAGAAKAIGKRPHVVAGTKGKTSTVYEVENEFTLVLWESESDSNLEPVSNNETQEVSQIETTEVPRNTEDLD